MVVVVPGEAMRFDDEHCECPGLLLAEELPDACKYCGCALEDGDGKDVCERCARRENEPLWPERDALEADEMGSV